MQVRESEKRLSRYLLGDLSTEERVEIEDSYLAESELFDQLLVAEDQLIDDYVRGNLSPKDHSLFEKNFLSSAERRNRLESARAILAFADKHGKVTAETRSLWQRLRRFLGIDAPIARLVLVTGFLIALIGGPVALFRINRLTSDLESLRETQITQERSARDLEQELSRQSESFKQSLADERRERGRLEQELENVREEVSSASQSAPPPQVFALGSGSPDGFPRNTGSDIHTVAIPKKGQRIQLTLVVPSKESQSYLVMVTDDQSNEIWRGDVRSKGGSLKLTLPARLFSSGIYRLILSESDAATGFERYFRFKVEK